MQNLAVGDGALGCWTAVREVFPETRAQRCWFHKIDNVLICLPKSAQPGAKAALAEIWNAENKEHAERARKAFAADYGVKWPKAAAKITEDLDVLLALYDYPAEHWIHLHTTNPIESTFATVRLRQRFTKGPGSRAAGVAMAFKLIESALSAFNRKERFLVTAQAAGLLTRERDHPTAKGSRPNPTMPHLDQSRPVATPNSVQHPIVGQMKIVREVCPGNGVSGPDRSPCS